MSEILVRRDKANNLDIVSFGGIGSFLATFTEHADLHATLMMLVNRVERAGVEIAEQSTILLPEPLRAKVLKIVSENVKPSWRAARLATVKAKREGVEYDNNRGLVVPSEPTPAGVARNVEYRAWLRTLGTAQQIEHLSNASVAQLDAVMEPGIRELLGRFDDQVWQQIADRYRELAHERFVRKNINDPKHPTLGDIAPIGVDDDKIREITEGAIAQRQRRIDDVENAERFLTQFVTVIAVMLEMHPKDAFEFLLNG